MTYDLGKKKISNFSKTEKSEKTGYPALPLLFASASRQQPYRVHVTPPAVKGGPFMT